VKQLIARMVGPKLRGLYQFRHASALDEWGWFNSIKLGFPCDKAGQPIPWISYSAFAILRTKVKDDWDVFEFGAGYSTLWWGKHCRSVTSCEHDSGWQQVIAKKVPGNCVIVSTDLNSEYPLAAARTGRLYDVIVIDGRKRVRCALSSVACLKDLGIMVWDDTDRPHYQGGLAQLAAMGFKRLDLIGMSPLINDAKQTSIIYRNANILGL